MTKALWLAALLAGTAVAVQAQNFDAQVSNEGLLRTPAVQHELGISPQQSKAIAQASMSQAPAMEKARKDPRALAAIRAQIRATTLAQISPTQLTRLREITLQQLGPQALTTPAVAAKVGVSDQQRKLIRSTYSSLMKEAMDAIRTATLENSKGSNGQPDRNKMREAAARAQQSVDFNQVRELASERSMAILSAEQRAAWKKLLGKPFNGAISPVVSGGGALP